MLFNSVIVPDAKSLMSALSMRSGVYVPLYKVANLPTLLNAMVAYKGVPVVVAINPASGPGTQSDPRFIDATNKLKDLGAVVLGYLATGYGGKPLATVQDEINKYASWYGALDGLMLDEQAPGIDKYLYYVNVTDYARSKGFDWFMGNPGNNCSLAFESILTSITRYEGAGKLPDASTLKGRPEQTTIVAYGVASLDVVQLRGLRSFVSLFYVTDDILPNPYDTLPPYLLDLFAALAD